MKKIVLLALCLMIMTAGAFAQDMAIGGGIMYNNTSSLMKQSGSYSYYGNISWEQEITMIRNGFGGFAFFGLGRFLELNLGFMYKNPSELKYKYTETDGYNTYTQSGTWKGSELEDEFGGTAALQLGIYFKYPIPINDFLVFFPTGGADFELSLSDEKWDSFSWWHDLWVRAGVGLDIFLGQKTFLRGHVIYGVALPIGADKDMGLTVGHGLLIKFGVGFML